MATLVQDRWARWTTTYDALGRPESVDGYMHPDGWPFTYSYDEVGNRTGLEFSGGRYTWAYDELDRNTAVADPGLPVAGLAGGTTSWQYDARNLVTRIDRPDASRSTFTYDAAGRT